MKLSFYAGWVIAGMFSRHVYKIDGIVLSTYCCKNASTATSHFCCKCGDSLYFQLLQVWKISSTNFTGNSAENTGGGVIGSDYLDLTVIGCVFSSNYAGVEGGAISVAVST